MASVWGPRVDRPHLSPPDELVASAIGGDPQAMKELIESSYSSLYRFLFFLSGSEPLSQDLAQDTLLKAMESLPRLREPSKYRSWLNTMAKNLFLDHLKAKKNQDHENWDDESTVTSFKSQSLQEDEQQDILLIRDTLQKLNPDYRSLLILVDMEGASYIEAAEALGISESALRSKLHRARQEFLSLYKKSATF